MSDKNNSPQPYKGGGHTASWREGEILIIESAVPSLQSQHTQCFVPVLVCSSSLMIQPISYYQLKHFWPGNKVQFIKLSSKGDCILAADLQYIDIYRFRPEREDDKTEIQCLAVRRLNTLCA